MATVKRSAGASADRKHFISETGEIIDEILSPQDGSSINYSFAHVRIPPGKSSPNHYHPVCEESYFFTAGEGVAHTWKTSDSAENKKVDVLKAGDTISILPNTWHQIWNNSQSEDLVFAVVCSPPWTPDCSVFEKN